MEKFIIILGSIIIPALTVALLVLIKKRSRAIRERERLKDHELIGTLEQLIEVKNDHIKRLK